jgi:hypothetical protein
MPETEAEQAAVMAAWDAWYAQLGAAIIDGGAPLGMSKTVAADGSVSTGGGANPLSGYTIVGADDLDGAVALAKGCPILSSGGTIEVAETLEM